jgi:cell wall-associated NlpC family hydrolase
MSQTAGGDAVSRAYGELGKPYSWGAVGPNSYDCSGLVSYCLTGKHTRIGTTYTFMSWPRVYDPQPGDICTNDHHCGIYIGDGQMIHAPRSGDVVKISGVHSGMIYVRY